MGEQDTQKMGTFSGNHFVGTSLGWRLGEKSHVGNWEDTSDILLSRSQIAKILKWELSYIGWGVRFYVPGHRKRDRNVLKSGWGRKGKDQETGDERCYQRLWKRVREKCQERLRLNFNTEGTSINLFALGRDIREVCYTQKYVCMCAHMCLYEYVYARLCV